MSTAEHVGGLDYNVVKHSANIGCLISGKYFSGEAGM